MRFDNVKRYIHVCNAYLIMWSFFQKTFAVVNQRNNLEIILSTVASISFVVIVTFSVIIGRLYMKNMSYRQIEQGEFCTKLDPSSFIAYVEHSDYGNQIWTHYLVV